MTRDRKEWTTRDACTQHFGTYVVGCGSYSRSESSWVVGWCVSYVRPSHIRTVPSYFRTYSSSDGPRKSRNDKLELGGGGLGRLDFSISFSPDMVRFRSYARLSFEGGSGGDWVFHPGLRGGGGGKGEKGRERVSEMEGGREGGLMQRS